MDVNRERIKNSFLSVKTKSPDNTVLSDENLNVDKRNIISIFQNDNNKIKKRFCGCKQFIIKYRNISYESVFAHFKQLLKENEIVSVRKIPYTEDIEVKIYLDNRVQLSLKHKLVKINGIQTPYQIQNVPKLSKKLGKNLGS